MTIEKNYYTIIIYYTNYTTPIVINYNYRNHNYDIMVH